jgi:NAD(P)-dependent dehydrogenase (short-subunit alcohol dehydrogenase family)
MNARLAASALAAGASLCALALRRRKPPYNFADRCVLITGGSRGLGLLLARRFAAEGARLAIVARDRADQERAAEDLRERGARVLALTCDVRAREQVEDTVRQVEQRLGPVDVLVNNAGVIQAGPFEHMSVADFEASLATHLWGPLYGMLAVLPGMRRRRSGRIVNIASIGGRIGVPHLAPYCTGKFALVGLSESLQAELRRDGVRVTTVCPGLLRTGSHLRAEFKGRHAKEFAWFTLSSSVPGLSMDGDKAARRIVEACRRGDPSLILTLPARAAVALAGVAPELIAEAMAQANRLLPSAQGPAGDTPRTGAESRSARAPRWATVLVDEAARRNNEMPA